MNTNKKKFISIFLSLIFCLSLTTNVNASIKSLDFNFSDTEPLSNTTIIVRDNDSTAPLPNNFRNLKELNISGSAEFRPFQLKNMIKIFTSEDLYIVDLRQESHGFINNLPISFYNKTSTLNKDFTTEETLESEKKDLDSVKIGSFVNIYHKNGKLIETLTPDVIFSEQTLVKENNTNYKRFAVKDGSIPSVDVTDSFVEFIKTKPPTAHLHFHCLHGKGRTTTFMALYQMMTNKEKISLDEILQHQLDAGGIDINSNHKRSIFLQSFYDYTLDNIDSNFSTNYSTWIKSN